ncbi:MAG: DUF4143 domain-containing protein [Oscillibacter sp.]|nr:DUF4143 domain-containing protein [Oscillibacter sp.]
MLLRDAGGRPGPPAAGAEQSAHRGSGDNCPQLDKRKGQLIDAFKTYVPDVGLLCVKKEIIPEDILYPTHDLDDFKGGMAENYVCNQLVAGGHSHYYWTGDHGYEVDFLIQLDGAVIPLEVKAAEHTQAKGLNACRKMHQPAYAIKLSGKNFSMEDGVKSVPLYAVFCI